MTVNGKTIWENCRDAPNWNPEVIRPRATRRWPHSGGIAVLRGNLAPDGAVLKPSAASPHLMRHRGRAVVFDNIEHYKARIADPSLAVDADSVLVLQEQRPGRLPGHGRSRQHGTAALDPEAGHHRHGAHLRRADERHGLRHRRPARLPGGGGRRTAGARAGRRPHRARRRGAPAASRRQRRGARTPPRRMAAATATRQTAATCRCTCSTCSRPTRAPISTSCSAAAGTRAEGVALAVRAERESAH